MIFNAKTVAGSGKVRRTKILKHGERRVHPQPTDGDIASAMHAFGLRQVSEAQPLIGGVDNHNMKVTTDVGDVVVRFYNIRSEENARDELALVEWLKLRGYPTPMPRVNTTGGHVTIVSRRPVAMFEFIHGAVPDAASPHVAGELGIALGALHRLTTRYRGPVTVMDRLELLRGAATRDYGLPDQDEWHSSVRQYLREDSQWLNAEVPGLPTAAIHHDLHTSNVLVRDQRLAAVLDFDEVNRAPLILDVLSTLYSFARQTAAQPVSRELARALFDAYAAVRPMSLREQLAVGPLFDLKNISEAALFLEGGASQLTSVRDCRSYQTYLTNRKSDFRWLFSARGVK